MIAGRPTFKQCKDLRRSLLPDLVQLRREIESSSSYTLEPGDLTLRLWLLPDFYYRHLQRRHTFRLAIWDSVALLTGRPTMRKVAELETSRPAKGPKVVWTIGKGLFCSTIATNDPSLFDAVVPVQEWRKGMEQMSRKDFLSEPPEIRLGRSQGEIGRLRESHEMAISVGIKPDDQMRVFGCLTATVPRGVKSLGEEEAAVIAAHLYADSSRIVDRYFSAFSKYKLPGKRSKA